MSLDLHKLKSDIKCWGRELGFQQVGITDTDVSDAAKKLQQWLAAGKHGKMHYMEAHGKKRWQPEALVPNTLRVISVRMDYLPNDANMVRALKQKSIAYISRYALGRDYHKLIRKRLQQLADKVSRVVEQHQYRYFTDSAPVLEKPLAQKAGLGWIGKHTNLINSKAGSWFFLGEIFTNVPLPIDELAQSHCGSCRACIDVCPTRAITAPYQLDARRCISYLTIELKDSIPTAYRSLIGNRIYGCDDCQLVCPWNKFASVSEEAGFQARHDLDRAELLTLWQWSEEVFLNKTAGSAIRRIGYVQWLRNIAVALGNAPYDKKIIQALQARLDHPSEMLREHITWALRSHHMRQSQVKTVN